MKVDDERQFQKTSWVQQLTKLLKPEAMTAETAATPPESTLLSRVAATRRALGKMIRVSKNGHDVTLPFKAVVVPPDGREWFADLPAEDPSLGDEIPLAKANRRS